MFVFLGGNDVVAALGVVVEGRGVVGRAAGRSGSEEVVVGAGGILIEGHNGR